MRKLRKTVQFAIQTTTKYAPANCRVYESGQIKTAFILGFFHPAIYLPKGLTDSGKCLILEHESVHIRRHDHQIKMAAWLILTLHWFNPLMWVSFWFLNKDMELSCDEQVLINLGSQIRADYSSLLLDLAAPNRISSGMPLSFSEGNTKIRIQNILNYRPIKFGSAAAAIFLIFVTVYGCMGNPQKEPDSITQTPDDAADEIDFVNTFVQHLIDSQAEDIYAVLSPELKEFADVFYNDINFGISLDAPEKHRRVNPFLPKEPPIIEQTATGYRYQLRRPECLPPEHTSFNSVDVWEGFLQLTETESGFCVTQWEDYTYNEIASRQEYDQNYQYYSFFIDAKEELDWITSHPEEAEKIYYCISTNEGPEKILKERFHLINGSITDIQKEDENHIQHITYSWEDGSIIVRMELLYDNFWYVTGVEA